jgi:hypothetical protein
MNLQDLTNPENSIPSPDEPVIDETEQEQEQIDDKPRCKYVSTKGKNVGKICGSILALESYYEIGLCKKHQTIVNLREKSAERKAKKESKSKEKGIVVQSPSKKQEQSNKSIEIISKQEPINEPVEIVDDNVEQIDLPTINIKLPQTNSDDENNVSNNYQEPVIDLSQTGNRNLLTEKKIQELYKVCYWLQNEFSIEQKDESLSSDEYYEIICKVIQDRNMDVCIFHGYSVSLQVIESILIQNYQLNNLKGWSNTVIANPEVRNTLRELRMIYLDNIKIGPESKLLFLTAMSGFSYYNSNHINNVINDNIPNKPSHRE